MNTGMTGWARRNKTPLIAGGTALGLGAAYLLKQQAKRKRQADELATLQQAAQQPAETEAAPPAPQEV